MICGLLGEKLSHSYSPTIHSFLGDYNYTLYEKKDYELCDFLRNYPFAGLNVTIPYKKEVIQYCDSLSPIAQKLGAVNTIVRKFDGTLVGHNTDYYGFLSMIERTGLTLCGKKALVLGSGGASNTVSLVLKELGCNVIVISRNGRENYHNICNHSDAAIIVNATPVGMYPNNGESPVDLNLFPSLEGVFDLIYNPARTKLLLQASARGLVAENGLWMLVAQAKQSAEWFTGAAIDDCVIDKIHSDLSRKMLNTILIGMPGSGKSTIGKHLANYLGKTFVDADKEIEETAQITIPEIFAQYGEQGFREMETAVLEKLGKKSGLVIATGGGCVTRQENYPLLHQNGRIYWLQRDIDTLPTDGRPLSKSCNLWDMYVQRKPLYTSFADYIINNNGSTDDAIARIRELEIVK